MLKRAEGEEFSSDGPAAATIAERLDAAPFCRLRLAILCVVTLALFADIAEVALGNALGAVFQAPPRSMTRTQLSVFLAAIFAGGAAGAPFFGLLGDRTGRRLALQLALLVIAAGSLGAAVSDSPVTLIGFRFLSGLGIGACPPLIAAYLADVMPPRWRGAIICVCAGLAFLGAPGIIFLMRATSPSFLGLEGWRWALGSGSVLAVIAAGLLQLLPESPRWLAAAGRLAEAETALLRFRGARSGAAMAPAASPLQAARPDDRDPTSVRRRFLLLCTLYALSPWATIGFLLMSGAVMLKKHFSVGDSVVAAGLIMFGPVIGNLLMALVIDRIDRKASLVATALAMAVLGLSFAAATDFLPLVTIGVAFAFCSAIYASVLGVYAAEIIPTALRSSRTALAWGIGRFVSIFVPLAFFPLLHLFGPWAMFGLIAAAVGLSALLVVAVGPQGRTRRPVA
ncbi:MFS transporter [Bosea sp. ASV33]|uniref:MFS transporter n=1 Tax=Bosea sp. ASV33 TaxID=2795106 RepID=UPI0018EB7EB7|nr:MFS transporter [Bosea sp. ASV33]